MFPSNKIILLLSALILSVSLFSQDTLKGVVIDASVNQKLEGVVIQYGNLQSDYAISDTNGLFTIPPNHNTILHIHALGYKNVSVLYSDLQIKPKIRLEPLPIELKEIVVSNVDANKLLDRILSNMVKSMVINQSLKYRTYFVQSLNNDSNRIEINLDYSVLLKKRRLRIGRMPYKLSLIDIELLGENTSSDIKDFANCEYFPSYILDSKQLKNYHVTFGYSEDNTIFILNASPKTENNRDDSVYKYYINENDSTIKYMEIDYTSPSNKKNKYHHHEGIKFAVKRKIARIEFEKYNDCIFTSSAKVIIEIHGIHPSGKEEDIAYYIDTRYVENIDSDKIINGKELNGFSNEFFKLIGK